MKWKRTKDKTKLYKIIDNCEKIDIDIFELMCKFTDKYIINKAIEFINDKIVKYGKAKGINTPINSTIVSLIKGSELPDRRGESGQAIFTDR